MDAVETAGTPLYQQVKDRIVRRIVEGDWAVGHRVPSENQLTREWDVSRMTVHRALRELTAEGWLTRTRGLGTFVAGPKPQSDLLEIRNIRDEIRERGHRHGCDVIDLRRKPASPEVAQALDLKPAAEVYLSTLIHREGGVAVQLEIRHVNPAFAPRYIEQDFTRITPYEYLSDLGPMDAAEHVIEAIIPSAEVARLLSMRPHEPVLLLTRRTWSNGLVVSRARFFHPGGRFRLAGRQEFNRRGHPPPA